MTKQNQEVGDGSIAAQAARDVTINQGLSVEECKELMHATLVAALPIYKAEMEEIAKGRMSELEDKIMKRISARPEISRDTLKDPDFHYTLNRAYNAYARSGDPAIGDTLVDLITDRAKQNDRTRLALSLNDAVEKVALLTKNEFAELSLMYILKLTRNVGVNNYDKFLSYLDQTVLPFVDDVSDDDSSYLYLEAQNCGSLPVLAQHDLRGLLIASYGGVLSNGTSKDNLKNSLPAEWQYIVENPRLVIPCIHDTDQWQISTIDKPTFINQLAKYQIAVPEDVAANVWNANEAAFWSEAQMSERIGARLPKFTTLAKLWGSTPLKSFRLSTIGIAIGHANARRIVRLEADLTTWIK
jgi:hypothetical protein